VLWAFESQCCQKYKNNNINVSINISLYTFRVHREIGYCCDEIKNINAANKPIMLRPIEKDSGSIIRDDYSR